MTPNFSVLAPRYEALWVKLEPDQKRIASLNAICNSLKLRQSIYEEASTAVWGKPDYWWYVAITDQMEGGGGAHTYLGNGQSLHEKTTEVPIGRGPFSDFVSGAVDALRGIPAPVNIAQAAYNWEGFNGWGYLDKSINDPYLASWSNEYTSGKYVKDHVFDPNAVSQQPGALTLLKVLKPDVLSVPAVPTHKPSVPSDSVPPKKGHVMVDVTQVVKDVNIGIAMFEKLLPFLSFILGPQVTAIAQAAITAVRTIESTAGVSTEAAVVGAISHLTPGADNHPALS